MSAAAPEVVHAHHPPVCGSDLDDGSKWTGDTSRVTCTSCKIALAVTAERERIAAWLTRAAEGRRECAASEPEGETRARLELAAACCESAAMLITDPWHMLDTIPAWRFNDTEVADLIRGGQTDG